MPDREILLVEDNPDDEELTVAALRKNGVINPIVVARDGVEALDYLFCEGAWASRDRSLRPQVILLDLKLPRAGGFDVLKRMRSEPEFDSVPVVVLTSSSEDEDMVRSYRLHANSYVRKPVDFRLFSEAVRHLGLYWLLLNEVPR
jgi:CheY-like chemotaxis protein